MWNADYSTTTSGIPAIAIIAGDGFEPGHLSIQGAFYLLPSTTIRITAPMIASTAASIVTLPVLMVIS